MFNPHFSQSFRLKLLSALLLSLLAAPAVMAEGSTGIRLGTTDFGGKETTRLGTSSDRHTTDRSWSRQSPDKRTWSRDGHSSGYDKGHYDDRHRSSRHEHHDRYRDHDYRHGGDYGGIKGHKSFGLSTYYNGGRHYSGYHYPNAYYRHQGAGVTLFYAPGVYRDDSYDQSTVITGYREPVRNTEPDYDSGINPWTALSDYQIHTARYAFEAQIQQQPHASLPRIGLALSTALAGDLNAGAFAMEDALLSDTSDLRYFSADQSLQLVLEELLLSYEGDPLMTASLHYLNRDYQAAERAVEVATNYCQQCAAVDKLAGLIDVHL